MRLTTGIIIAIIIVIAIISLFHQDIYSGLSGNNYKNTIYYFNWNNTTLIPGGFSASISTNGYCEVPVIVPPNNVTQLTGYVEFDNYGAQWFLFGQNQYNEFLQNHAFWVNNVSYVGGSGRVNNGLPLSPATYYLVFYNGASTNVTMIVLEPVITHSRQVTQSSKG